MDTWATSAASASRCYGNVMHLASRRALSFTVCVRDDDAKLFEFRVTSDVAVIKALVKAAASRGRRVRCEVLAADPNARTREETYLVAKGFTQGEVEL